MDRNQAHEKLYSKFESLNNSARRIINTKSLFQHLLKNVKIAGIMIVMTSLIAIISMTGCEEGNVPNNGQELPPEYERLITHDEYQENSVIVEWNELAVETANEVDGFLTLLGHRTLAMMHLAMHDALNAIVPIYDQYTYTEFESGVDASPVAAASQAAKDILANAYPDYMNEINALHEKWLKSIPEQDRKTWGMDLGSAAASAILEQREGDNFRAEGSLTSSEEPGGYRVDPPFEDAAGTGWPETRPFAMISADQFRPAPQPDLTSNVYTDHYNEVKALGGELSEIRTSDQTHIALWWAEFAEILFGRVGRILIDKEDLHPWRAARLFALFYTTNFDGYVSVFEAKYTYNFWRPQRAIREADADGNPETNSDSNWTSLMPTLPFPDYPSAHAQACQGAAEVFAEVFDTRNLAFEIETTTAPENGPYTRSYDNLDEAVKNCGLSRLYNGYHFRFAIDAGWEMGRERSIYLLDNYLQRSIDIDHPGLEIF